MRIWVGKEMEGKYLGDITMFLETKYLTTTKMTKFLDLLDEHPEVTNVYLGAGRVDLKTDTTESVFLIKSLIELCHEKGLKITIETTNLSGILSITELVKTVLQTNVQLVNRIDVAKNAIELVKHITNKLDDTKDALLSEFKPTYTTDITGVRYGMYKKVDKILYQKKED